jgi:PAS domain S-box-containing protein
MTTLFSHPLLQASDYRGQVLTGPQLSDKTRELSFCVTDHRGYFLEVNQAYCELYGYLEEELIGRHFTMVVPENYREMAKQIHDEFIAGKLEMPGEWVVQRKDGEQMRIFVEALRAKVPGEPPKKITILDRIY